MLRLAPLFLLPCLLTLASCSSQQRATSYQHKYEPGKSAILKGRVALVHKSTPAAVQKAVAAGNRLQGKPYIYGGGHRRIEDIGYDCSGTQSYVLYHAGLIKGTMASDEFRDFGKPGPGKWITIYAKRGHVFSSIAGLRLDTGYNGQGEGPRWSTKPRPAKGYVMRHPDGY